MWHLQGQCTARIAAARATFHDAYDSSSANGAPLAILGLPAKQCCCRISFGLSLLRPPLSWTGAWTHVLELGLQGAIRDWNRDPCVPTANEVSSRRSRETWIKRTQRQLWGVYSHFAPSPALLWADQDLGAMWQIHSVSEVLKSLQTSKDELRIVKAELEAAKGELSRVRQEVRDALKRALCKHVATWFDENSVTRVSVLAFS